MAFGHGLDALGSNMKPFCVLGRPLGPKEAKIAIQEARRGPKMAKRRARGGPTSTKACVLRWFLEV